MKYILSFGLLIILFSNCVNNTNNSKNLINIQNIDSIKNKITLSVEVLKTEQISEPVKLFYYLVSRDINKKIIDSTLLMSPLVYDYRVKDFLWSKDSSFIIFENPQFEGKECKIIVFDTKQKKEIFQVNGFLMLNYFRCKNCYESNNYLEKVFFYKLNYMNSNLSIFTLTTKTLKIDSILTTKTLIDEWEYPSLIKTDWEKNEFEILHFSSYNNENHRNEYDTIRINLE